MALRRKPSAGRSKSATFAPSMSTRSPQPPRGVPAGTPIFAEPTVAPDPTKYKTPHASDTAAYAEMDALIKASKFLPLPFPAVPNVSEPILTLSAALGSAGAAAIAKIQAGGQIVFHAAGDTGATRGPKTENTVVDKMLSDFTGEASSAVPQFFYNLGDIVYSFGEHKYYYDQFYDAYRDYPAPIFAIPGNHDGIVLPPPAGTGNAGDSLAAFLANFCAPGFAHSPDATGLSRTTMIQPGVYYTLEAPFVRILGLYSNMLENPGVISSTKDPATGTATEVRWGGPDRRASSAVYLWQAHRLPGHAEGDRLRLPRHRCMAACGPLRAFAQLSALHAFAPDRKDDAPDPLCRGWQRRSRFVAARHRHSTPYAAAHAPLRSA
jgi:hypothetical protein